MLDFVRLDSTDFALVSDTFLAGLDRLADPPQALDASPRRKQLPAQSLCQRAFLGSVRLIISRSAMAFW